MDLSTLPTGGENTCGKMLGGMISFPCRLSKGHETNDKEPCVAPEVEPTVRAHDRWEEARRAPEPEDDPLTQADCERLKPVQNLLAHFGLHPSPEQIAAGMHRLTSAEAARLLPDEPGLRLSVPEDRPDAPDPSTFFVWATRAGGNSRVHAFDADLWRSTTSEIRSLCGELWGRQQMARTTTTDLCKECVRAMQRLTPTPDFTALLGP